MKLVIEIGTFTEDPAEAEAILRRRLLSGPRSDLQIGGFQCTVIGEATDSEMHMPPGIRVMVVQEVS